MGRFSKISSRFLLGAAAVIGALAGLPLSGAAGQTTDNWPTYLGNVSRTGYSAAKSALTRSTAPKLARLWTDHAPGAISAEPIQVNGVVYYGSWDGYESAVSAGTGGTLWSAYLGQTTDAHCPARSVGVASTPVVGTVSLHGIATPALFVGGGDGSFYALNAATGSVIWQTQLGAPPDHFLWSSPLLHDGSVYEGIASLGDCPLIRGGIVRMNASTGAVQDTLYTVPAGCTGASVWGSPSLDSSTGDLYFATGNGGSCASSEPLAVAVVQTDSSLNVLSSWQVPPAQHGDDSDFGSTPTLFAAKIGGAIHQMVGIQNKNGTYYAFDRASLSAGPAWQKQISIGGPCPGCGTGADISPSAYNGHHLFVAGEGTTISGVSCAGSILSLQPSTGATVWADCLPNAVLGAVTGVPGVVFVGASDTVYALASRTGSTLWSYQDKASHSDFWGAVTPSGGQVYVGNQDGNLSAFGT